MCGFDLVIAVYGHNCGLYLWVHRHMIRPNYQKIDLGRLGTSKTLPAHAVENTSISLSKGILIQAHARRGEIIMHYAL